MHSHENTTEYRRTLRKRILDFAMPEFASRGIRAVKMDEIAHKLSISKRTLYEIYSSKEELLYEGLQAIAEESALKQKKISEECDNVMDILIRTVSMRIEELRGTNNAFFNDLMRYSRILDYFEETQAIRNNAMRNFLKRGQEEGYFKADYNYNLVVMLLNSSERRITLKKMLNEYSMEEIFFNMMFVVIRGVCTPKGIDILDRFAATYLIKDNYSL